MTAPGAGNPSLSLFRLSNFAPAFIFLPSSRRRALKAVYAFCRCVDDAVDASGRPTEETRKTLEAWRTLLRAPQAANPQKAPSPEVWSVLQESIEKFAVPPRHLLDLVDGVERDMTIKRYGTFEELKTYCHGVASTVGLACLPIFGLDEPSHKDFANNLGLAVQLTNILRDVRTDGKQDRIYLPQEDLKRFGYTEKQLLDGEYNPNFVRLMRFEGSRAKDLYAAAWKTLPPFSRPAARPALAMGRIYKALLDKLEESDYKVFEKRWELTKWEKIRCLAGTFFS